MPGDVAPLLCGEVQHDAALVAVAAEVICRLAPDVRRPPPARVVPQRRFYLDDIRPQSPSIIVQYGPASTREKSSTRIPSKGDFGFRISDFGFAGSVRMEEV